jgi:ERCC4-type nuclease
MLELLSKKTSLRPLILAERKKISDFCQSYKSGRIQSQRARISSFRDQTNCLCYLVVEEYFKEVKRTRNNMIYGFSIDALEQCWVSTNVRDRLHLEHVKDTTEHAKFILRELKTLEKYKLYNGDSSHVATNSFNESLKLKNKNNLTVELFYQKTIADIPMFSMDIAEKITKLYPSLTRLQAELTKNGINTIKDIKINKNRLGDIKAQRLLEYLLPSDTGSGATIDTGIGATIDTGIGATIDTGSGATIDTGIGAIGTIGTIDASTESSSVTNSTSVPIKLKLIKIVK